MTPVTVFSVLIATFAIAWLVRGWLKPSHLPPSPPGLPILGNLFQIPMKMMFVKLDEWKKELGPIYTLNVAGQKIIVLGSAKTAADVMDRMSAVTSGRPRLVMTGEIMSRNLMFGTMPYADRWRRLRRMVMESFNQRAVEGFRSMQVHEASLLVLGLLEDQSNLPDHLQRAAASAVWRAVYGGKPLQIHGGTKVEKVYDIMQTFMKAAIPTAYMVNIFPFLKSVPAWAAGWKNYGESVYHGANTYFEALFEESLQQEEDGQFHRGFIASSKDSQQKFEVGDNELAWTAGSIFLAGAETTSVALQFFVLAMVLNPGVARKAQKQLDRVVGNRPPTFENRDSLPYVTAIMKETARWRPGVPAGLPHVATKDFAYDKYIIPEGSMIIANIWSISHDPTVFDSPSTFRPERFISSTDPDKLKDPAPDYHDDLLMFGFGRRICPGASFATNTLWIDIAYMLWAFEFERAKDAQGKEIVPNAEELTDSGLAVHPAPFEYVLKPRHANLASLLKFGET